MPKPAKIVRAETPCAPIVAASSLASCEDAATTRRGARLEHLGAGRALGYLELPCCATMRRGGAGIIIRMPSSAPSTARAPPHQFEVELRGS